MKFLLVLVCAIVACRAELGEEFVAKYVAKVTKISKECAVETKASDDDVKSVLKHQVPETKEGKCLIFCFHKHFHIQNDDGSLNKEGALESLEPIKEHDADLYDKIVKMFKTCGEEASADSDPCIYASNLAECAIKEGKSMGLDELLVMNKNR